MAVKKKPAHGNLAAGIVRGLKKSYPDAHCELDYADPVQLLVATILSARMMLEWWRQPEAAARIEKAVAAVFADPRNRTRDMRGSCSTEEMGSLVVEQIVA